MDLIVALRLWFLAGFAVVVLATVSTVLIAAWAAGRLRRQWPRPKAELRAAPNRHRADRVALRS
jgi:hypothetical protein